MRRQFMPVSIETREHRIAPSTRRRETQQRRRGTALASLHMGGPPYGCEPVHPLVMNIAMARAARTGNSMRPSHPPSAPHLSLPRHPLRLGVAKLRLDRERKKERSRRACARLSSFSLGRRCPGGADEGSLPGRTCGPPHLSLPRHPLPRERKKRAVATCAVPGFLPSSSGEGAPEGWMRGLCPVVPAVPLTCRCRDILSQGRGKK